MIDRESPTTGVWVLDWDIYNRIINEISSIAREVDQGGGGGGGGGGGEAGRGGGGRGEGRNKEKVRFNH